MKYDNSAKLTLNSIFETEVTVFSYSSVSAIFDDVHQPQRQNKKLFWFVDLSEQNCIKCIDFIFTLHLVICFCATQDDFVGICYYIQTECSQVFKVAIQQ